MFADSLTAAATGYGVLPVRPAALQKPTLAEKPLPSKLSKPEFANQAFASSHRSESNRPAIERSVLINRSTAIIRNISARAASMLPATRKLARPAGGTIFVEVLPAIPAERCQGVNQNDAHRPGVGTSLLIDKYVPSCLEKPGITSIGQRPAPLAALSVPAMTIATDGSNMAATSGSASAIFESAKAVVKSVIRLIKPVIGLRQALWIPQEIQQRMYRIDELVLSSSSLKLLWNNCSFRK